MLLLDPVTSLSDYNSIAIYHVKIMGHSKKRAR